MSPRSNDAHSSLIGSHSTSHYYSSPQSGNPGGHPTASPFENDRPDDDCEPRRRLALFHLKDYCEARKSFSGLPDDTSNFAVDHMDNSPSAQKRRADLNVTADLMNSGLVMLKDTLDRMVPSARRHALKGDLGFVLTTIISILGASSSFVRRSHLLELLYVLCAAAGLHGAWRTAYWWAASQCSDSVEVLQDKLEKAALRDSHRRYLDGMPWSILRNASL